MDLLAMLEELDDGGREVVLAAAEDPAWLAIVCAAAEIESPAPTEPGDGARWLLARAREALAAGEA